jgi:hypothetical protein
VPLQQPSVQYFDWLVAKLCRTDTKGITSFSAPCCETAIHYKRRAEKKPSYSCRQQANISIPHYFFKVLKILT